MTDKKYKEITLLELTRFFLKNIWVFILIFIVVFSCIFLYLFLKPEKYTYTSNLRISEDYIRNNNELYSYYPEEMEDLWLFPTDRRNQLINTYINIIASELYSDDVISDLEVTPETDIQDIRSYIDIIGDDEEDIVIINTTYSSSDTAKEINSQLVNIYIDKRTNEFEEAYKTLLEKVTADIDDLVSMRSGLISEEAENDAEFRIENSRNINERDADYLAERLAKMESLNNQIYNLNQEYNLLSATQNNLLNNKDFFINRIDIIQKPRLSGSEEFNLAKSIIYSVIIGIIAAFIITFIVAVAFLARKARKN